MPFSACFDLRSGNPSEVDRTNAEKGPSGERSGPTFIFIAETIAQHLPEIRRACAVFPRFATETS
jgi:hypothetical protein